jgi:hypothetical protein
MEMSEKSIKEYTEKMRERYGRMTGKQARSRLPDEYTQMTGFERKYANKVLGHQRRCGGKKSRRGAPVRYGAEVLEALKVCWLAMEQPCGKRLKDTLPLWAGFFEGTEKAVCEKRLSMSSASMDRLLRTVKTGGAKKRLPPRSNAAIQARVEIRAESWNTKEAGWTEADTVAHCGGDLGGSFIWTLTSVDIASGWTEIRASWNRGQHATRQGLEEIARAQPFDLKGVDSDNGAEFLNCHLCDWLREQGVHQTRSRPCRKNDQAHVEQKNCTPVRLLPGYDRLEHPELIAPLNELLRAWSLWRNLHCVTGEQISKHREGSRQIRRHARTSRTPAQRLLDGKSLAATQREWIETQQQAHNPFAMKKEIEAQLAALWKQKRKNSKSSLQKPALPLRRPLRCAAKRPERQADKQPKTQRGRRVLTYEATQPDLKCPFGALLQ